MRLLPLIAPLALLACSSESTADEALLAPGSYRGAGRDALCIRGDIAPQRGAFIVFAGKGDTNCAADGTLERIDAGWTLVPAGEGPCRIPLAVAGDLVRLGTPSPSCAYYCGPAAAIGGQALRKTEGAASPPGPLAPDGLC